MKNLSRLLRPRSVAVMGGGWAANVIEQCQRMGFDGQVWPVHPTRSTIGGLPAVPSLADLPAAPDATFIGVNRDATLQVVGELAAMGAGGAVAFASGWSETGAAAAQAQLVAAAGTMPVLGPNCYGIINYLDGALLWPDQHGGQRVDSGVAVISQSSNIAVNLTMQARALPLAYVACLGNAAQVGLAELGRALLQDPRVTALGLYVEGITDAPALAALAQEAAARGKGIVAIKSGRTEASRAAAASHTAALAGDSVASSAFLHQAGIAEVETPAELLETLKILHAHGPGLGHRLCSLSCSGGEAGMIADLAARHRLDFPPPGTDSAARLSAALGPMVTISNPLDYHTFIWGDGARIEAVFSEMLSGYDAGLFVIDPPRPDRCDPSSFTPALDAIAAAGVNTGKPAFAVASLPENFDEALARSMAARGVVVLMGAETALTALAAAQTPPAATGWAPWPAPPARDVHMLDEAAAKTRLAQAGIAVPRGVAAPDLPALARAAHALTPPLALKGLGFAHKSEAGAVRLNLTTLEGQPEIPGALGYLAEEMIPGALAELILGARRDPVYGATLTLGFGGTAAELLGDTVTLVLPVTPTEITAALRRLRLWPLLDGYRGRPRADVDAVVQAAMTLQDMLAQDPALEEVEINPLLVRESGAMAADAVIWEAVP